MSIKRRALRLSKSYGKALLKYLAAGPKSSLLPAGQLGRQALSLGLETLDLALIHEQAFSAHLLEFITSASRRDVIRRSGHFFAEAILPLEKSHRPARESALHVLRLNQSLKLRALALATSNERLNKEVNRRKAVVENLRRSESNTRRLLEQSKHLQEQLRSLSRWIISAQEEERKRISRDLHDVIAQMLTGINMRLASLKAEAATSARGLALKITQTQRLVEKSVDLVHRFARELRPAVLDHLGLIPALHSHLKMFSGQTGLLVKFTAYAGVEKLSAAKRTVLYRVAREALDNVASHAAAGHVDIGIHKLVRAVRMRIQDDGKAFKVDQIMNARKGRRLGLLGMRERVEMVGGSFAIDSVPGRGTLIEVRIPHKTAVKEHASP